MADKETPVSIPEQCPHCEKVVDMTVQAQWESFVPETGDLPLKWTSVQCPNCTGVCLYLQEYFGPEVCPPDGWDERYQMYPAQARRLSADIPSELRDDYREARECVKSKLYTAAAVMARRTLEGITIDQGYTKGALFNRLKLMRDDAVIDSRLYDWADICRDVGNQAAHASKQSVSREDATETLDFVEALLDYLYVFQSRYQNFKARRDAAKASAK
ncbi:DUF4145 domain-containing protein [Candidatus Saccharibacteria bacterium]|nr:DUF4145 domain-containing protein [Candidatus Saccharibacteria bacterium]